MIGKDPDKPSKSAFKEKVSDFIDELIENEDEFESKDVPEDLPEDNDDLLDEESEDDDPINKLESENAELKNQLLRTLAEYDNFRKRSQKEKESIYTDAQIDTISKIIIVLDSFELALKSETTDENFKKGFELIFAQLTDALGKIGVESIEGIDEPFNPEFQNAVMHIEDENAGENIVVEILQKGYRLGDKVIRYAMVKVAN